jgi:hypothetical protein
MALGRIRHVFYSGCNFGEYRNYRDYAPFTSVLAVSAIKLDTVRPCITYGNDTLGWAVSWKVSRGGDFSWILSRGGRRYRRSPEQPQYPCFRNLHFWTRAQGELADHSGSRLFSQKRYPPIFRKRVACRCRPSDVDVWRKGDSDLDSNSYTLAIEGLTCHERYASAKRAAALFVQGLFEPVNHELATSGHDAPVQPLEETMDVQVDFDDTELEAFESEVRSQHVGRKIFETTQTLGFGPVSVQPGDTVWRLQGAAVLLVLRQISENQYTVIGECYVHGADRLEGCWSSELETLGRCYVHGAQREEKCGIPQMIKLH